MCSVTRPKLHSCQEPSKAFRNFLLQDKFFYSVSTPFTAFTPVFNKKKKSLKNSDFLSSAKQVAQNTFFLKVQYSIVINIASVVRILPRNSHNN